MSILLVNVVCPYMLSADSALVVQRKRSSIRLWMLRSKAAPYCILSCDLQGETSALPCDMLRSSYHLLSYMQDNKKADFKNEKIAFWVLSILIN